ncbi:MAG: acetate--CoA ligase, partial [Pseudomonadota bacterium]
MADIFPVPESIAANAHIDKAKYDEMYARSVADPDGFWRDEAQRIDWMKPFTKVKNVNFNVPDVSIKWFEDGTLNVAANCIDRHLATRGDQTALIWEQDDIEAEPQHITYRQLHEHVCKFANVLKELGIGKGDRVIIYMPMIPQAAYAMLACARIGAIHSVVFAGFSPDSLANRVNDCGAKLVITADGAPRGGRTTKLKENANKALSQCDDSVRCLVVRRTGQDVPMRASGDHWLHEMEAGVSADCPPEEMNAEDPLFILYTSGSTGKPKGVVHTTGGYLVYAAMTHKLTFDYQEGEVYWCTADVGWVTGHTYIVYGPLANGAVSLMFEGVPTYPDAGRFWAVCERHKVASFYTAPTAIRALMGKGDEPVKKHDLSSLRILGTVGEPINPEAWRWYSEVIGGGRCPVVDTFWQTETGGHIITPLPGATALKPGSATTPFFGVKPAVLDAQSGTVKEGATDGVLVITDSWPGQMRTVWGDHERFEKTYFSDYKGYYFTGDGCRR